MTPCWRGSSRTSCPRPGPPSFPNRDAGPTAHSRNPSKEPDVKAPKATRKRINFKAALILAGSCAALAAVVHVVHGHQVKRHAHGLIDDADQAEQRGDTAQTADCLSQYILLVPGDA